MSFEGFSKLDAFVFDLQLFGESVTIQPNETKDFGEVSYENRGQKAVTLEENNGVVTVSGDNSLFVVVTGLKLLGHGIMDINIGGSDASLDTTGEVPKLSSTVAFVNFSENGNIAVNNKLYEAIGASWLVFENNVVSLRDGSVKIAQGSITTSHESTVENKSDKKITIHAESEITAMEDGAECEIKDIGGSYQRHPYFTVLGKKYTTKSDTTAALSVKCESENTAIVTLTAGSILLEKGVSIVANGVTYTNTSDADDKTFTVTQNGEISGLTEGASYEVTFATGATFTIGGSSYTAAEGGATFRVTGTESEPTVTFIGGAVTLGNGGTILIGDKTYKATVNNTTLSVAADGKIALTSGAVEIPYDGSVVTHSVTVTNTATADLTVQAKNGEAIVTTAAGGSCSAVIGAGKKATIDGTTYTNASTTATATITMAHGGTAKLTAGSVIPSYGYLTANDVTFYLTTDTITVDSDGKVTLPASSTPPYPNYYFYITIPAGKIASVNGKTYTAKEYQVALFITSTNNGFSPFDARFGDNSAGSVVLGADAALSVKQSHGNYVTFTNTLADKTVEVDKSGNIRAMSEGAACKVSLNSGTSVTVAGKTYTATNGATLSVLAASEVTKNEGSAEVTLDNRASGATNAVKFSKGVVIIANGVTVTNTADAELTVQAMGGDATVTTAAGGSCSAVIGTDEDATIDGVTYTNASATATATLTMEHGGTAVLTAGAVTITAGGSVTVVGDSSQTSKITTTSATAQIAVQNGTYTLSNLTNNEGITIDGVTYTYNDTNKTLLDTTAGVTTGFLLKNSLLGNGSATFAIKGDTTTASDTIDPASGTKFFNITRPGDLAAAIAGLKNVSDALYFDAYGNQQGTKDGASYDLIKTSDRECSLHVIKKMYNSLSLLTLPVA